MSELVSLQLLSKPMNTILVSNGFGGVCSIFSIGVTIRQNCTSP